MDSFKNRLNEALEKRQTTAAELARITNVNESAISQYRRGSYKASQRTLELLARALNVPIPWLMGVDMPSPFEKEYYEEDMLKIYRTLSEEAQATLLGCLQRKDLDINKLFEKREISDLELEYVEMYRALPAAQKENVKMIIKTFYDAMESQAQEKEEA